jgi:hypothetical protein
MANVQDQSLGQKYFTVREKFTGEDHELLLHLDMDVPAARLTQQIMIEFQAGEGYSKIPTGSDAAPTGHTLSLGPVSAAPRSTKLTGDGGSPDLDMGLSLHENSIREFDVLEIVLRT